MIGVLYLFGTCPLQAYDLKTEKIELIGTEKVYMSDVFINIDEETTLNAQSIILDKEKQKLVSLGDFTLSSKLGVLKGKDIDYDLTSETFVAKEVTFIDDLNSNYVKSESVSGSREYLDFENVIYTTCKPNEPGWTIQANYIRFYPENYGYGYNFRFFLHDFPLFYLPFMSFPTTTKRTTGFLAPSFSWLKSDEPKDNLGFRTELPYFINLGLDHDATVTLDLVQYRGIGLGFQYRYAFVENMFGQFDYWRLQELNADRTQLNFPAKKEEDPSNLPRSYLTYKHRQKAFFDHTLQFNIENYSDGYITDEYLGIDENNYQNRSIYYTIPLQAGYLIFHGQYNADYTYNDVYKLQHDSDEALQKLPEIVFNYNFFDLPFSGFIFTVDNTFDRFSRNNGWNGNRNIFKPTLNYNNNFLFFDYKLSVGPVNKWYSNFFQYLEPSPEDYETKDDPVYENPDTTTYNASITNKKLNAGLSYRGYMEDDPSKSWSQSFLLDYYSDEDQREALSYNPNSFEFKNDRTDYDKYSERFDSNDKEYGYSTFTIKSVLNLQPYFKLSVTNIFDMWRKDDEEETESFFKGPYIEEEYRENPYGRFELPVRARLDVPIVSDLNFFYFTRYDRFENARLEYNYGLSYKGNTWKAQAKYSENYYAYKTLTNTLFDESETFSVSADITPTKYLIINFNSKWDYYLAARSNQNFYSQYLDEVSLDLSYLHPCYRITMRNVWDYIQTTDADNQITSESNDYKVQLSFEIIK